VMQQRTSSHSASYVQWRHLQATMSDAKERRQYYAASALSSPQTPTQTATEPHVGSGGASVVVAVNPSATPTPGSRHLIATRPSSAPPPPQQSLHRHRVDAARGVGVYVGPHSSGSDVHQVVVPYQLAFQESCPTATPAATGGAAVSTAQRTRKPSVSVEVCKSNMDHEAEDDDDSDHPPSPATSDPLDTTEPPTKSIVPFTAQFPRPTSAAPLHAVARLPSGPLVTTSLQDALEQLQVEATGYVSIGTVAPPQVLP
jgi:hypothetical protein